MPKYYTPKEKHERTEEYNKKQKKLFLDKRVKSIVNCNDCGNPITLNESKRNGGVCDTCYLPF